MVELKNDIFIIPINENKNIIYSPLRKCAFITDEKGAKLVEDYLFDPQIIFTVNENNNRIFNNLKELEKLQVFEPKTNERIYTKDRATIILSQKCNLACSYCYSTESRSKETLSKEHIKQTINYIFFNESKKSKYFSFIGGGEPTITWELFKWSVEYIRDISLQIGIIANIGLTTNATLLDKRKIIWLKENKVNVGISYDILPNIQNSQRPFYNRFKNSFEIVDENLKQLIEMGFSCRIRSTITKENVNLMSEMVKFVNENYPQIKHLHFEPVTDNNIDNYSFYNSYLENYFDALELAKQSGIKIRNSITTSFTRLDKRFCRGEFCITPTGKIVSCHRVSSENDDFFENFHYGTITNKINIDEKMENNVMTKNNDAKLDCAICFAKWHCAGGCPSNRFIFSEKQKINNCNFTRNMIKKILETNLKF